MELKQTKKNRTETIKIRCSIEEYNRLQTLANLYCNGNLSQFMRYSGLNFIPGIEDFKKEKAGKNPDPFGV